VQWSNAVWHPFRVLADKHDTVQGGNRVVDMTYALTVENFGSKAVDVRLLDRLPRGKSSQVRVELLSDESDLCDDSDYVRTLRKESILRWDVSVPAKATGADAHTVEYRFRLEYDKQMSVAGVVS